MKAKYVRYSIAIGETEQREILIAHLSEWGIEGFDEEAEALNASGQLETVHAESVENYLAQNDISYSKSIVENQNWNAIWESSFEPVLVDDFVAVRADFHAPVENVAHEIVITPKMSFGTGHHATTYLVMKLMQDLDFDDATVFDFGTGTGILAILAEKLGAAAVLAIDNDDWCIENANENCAANDCKKVILEKATEPPSKKTFKIILANINKNVILANIDGLAGSLENEGQLILSGLLVEDEKSILEDSTIQKFSVINKLERNGWIAIHLQKQNET